ncbi:hypothetical protein [Pasteuria penetrans]|nr:hypothetical protein [Pasteuria penetrans]
MRGNSSPPRVSVGGLFGNDVESLLGRTYNRRQWVIVSDGRPGGCE